MVANSARASTVPSRSRRRGSASCGGRRGLRRRPRGAGRPLGAAAARAASVRRRGARLVARPGHAGVRGATVRTTPPRPAAGAARVGRPGRAARPPSSTCSAGRNGSPRPGAARRTPLLGAPAARRRAALLADGPTPRGVRAGVGDAPDARLAGARLAVGGPGVTRRTAPGPRGVPARLVRSSAAPVSLPRPWLVTDGWPLRRLRHADDLAVRQPDVAPASPASTRPSLPRLGGQVARRLGVGDLLAPAAAPPGPARPAAAAAAPAGTRSR